MGYGWNVTRVGDANDLELLTRAFEAFQDERGAPDADHRRQPHRLRLAAQAGHRRGPRRAARRGGGARDEARLRLARGRRSSWSPTASASTSPTGIGRRGAELRAEWEQRCSRLRARARALAAEIERDAAPRAARGLGRRHPELRRRREGDRDPQGLEPGRERDRRAGPVAARRLGRPHRLDLGAASTFDGAGDFEPDNRAGRQLHYGIREHESAAISNGLSLSKLRPLWSTYLTFSDYARPAIRLSALMELPVNYYRALSHFYLLPNACQIVQRSAPTLEDMEDFVPINFESNLPAQTKLLRLMEWYPTKLQGAFYGVLFFILLAYMASASKSEFSLLSILTMKYIQAFFVSAILACVTYYSAVLILIDAPVPAEYWVGEMITIKKELVKKHAGKSKIIIAGGSSTLFGIDAEYASKSLDIPVLNFGLHAGLRLERILQIVSSVIEQGDVLVLALEPPYYDCNTQLNSGHVTNIIGWDHDAWKNMNYSEKFEFVTLVSPTLLGQMLVAEILKKLHPASLSDRLTSLDSSLVLSRFRARTLPSTFEYSAYNLNSHGDMQRTEGSRFKGQGYDVGSPAHVCDKTADILISFVDRMKKKGVLVYFANIPYIASELVWTL